MRRPRGYLTLERMRDRPRRALPLWPALALLGAAAWLAAWWGC